MQARCTDNMILEALERRPRSGMTEGKLLAALSESAGDVIDLNQLIALEQRLVWLYEHGFVELRVVARKDTFGLRYYWKIVS